MIEKLLYRFVKNADDRKNPEVRSRTALFGEAVLIVCRFIIFLIKLITGLAVHSVAIRADAWNDFGTLTRAGFRIADARIAERHPTENTGKVIRRAKYVLAFIAAFLIFETGFSFFSRAFTRLLRPSSAVPGIAAVLFVLGAGALRFWLAGSEKQIGYRAGYVPLLSDAACAKRELIVTGICLVGAVIDRFLHFNLDYAATLAAAFFVMKAGVMIVIEVVRPSIEETPDPEFAGVLRERLRACDVIAGTGRMKLRFFGPGRHLAAVSVKVSKDSDAAETQNVLREIEKTLGEELGVTLVLKPDPVDTDDADTLLFGQRLETLFASIDQRIYFDRLHKVRVNEETVYVLDLTLPLEYGEEDAAEVIAAAQELAGSCSPPCQCKITRRQNR